jgi:hypothetical protein
MARRNLPSPNVFGADFFRSPGVLTKVRGNCNAELASTSAMVVE